MRFKILVQLDERALNKKLMVFHEESWKKIEDLENHIKRVLKLGDLQLEVYIEDFWVPSCEKLSVIKPSDEVIIKEVVQASAVENPPPTIVTSQRKSSKGEPKNNETPVTDNHVAMEDQLMLKKRELLYKVASMDDNEMDVTDFGEKKRKRKRKHKKSSRIPLLDGVTLDSQQCAPREPFNPTETTSRVGHIRFDEEDDKDTAVPHLGTEEQLLNDWQKNLLSLAQERNKNVFTRRPLTNGMNGTAHDEIETAPSQSPPVASSITNQHPTNASSELSAPLPLEDLKTSDLINFKKLTMMDSSPIISDSMLAVIEEIELGEMKFLTLKICEGHTDGTFNAEEIKESEGDFLIVKLEWSQILEPRLVINPTVLSKYL
ncbi:hypothetical protein GE061_016577 [Apolygus lucorum]|uniref:Coilin n=1 Tax=Apolygus lucorum TaxID=248454 RepID=A0A6A4JWU2_APOLU|nr:hypothetical protein GE061_016577 [Apolygus lucorum]